MRRVSADSAPVAWPLATQAASGSRSTDMIVVNGGGATELVVRMRAISTMHADGFPPRVRCFVNGSLWCQLYLFPHESRGMEGVAFDRARRVIPTAAELALLRARCALLPSGTRNVMRIEVCGALPGAANPEFASSERRTPANPHFSEEEVGVASAAAVKDEVSNPHAPSSADAVENPNFDGVDAEGEAAGAGRVVGTTRQAARPETCDRPPSSPFLSPRAAASFSRGVTTAVRKKPLAKHLKMLSAITAQWGAAR